MERRKILLLYNKRNKIIDIPDNYIELEKAFLKEFNEDKNKQFSFYYDFHLNKKTDFSKLNLKTSNNLIKVVDDEELKNKDNIIDEDNSNEYLFLNRKKIKKLELNFDDILKENQELKKVNYNLLQKNNELEMKYNMEVSKNKININKIKELKIEINNIKENKILKGSHYYLNELKLLSSDAGDYKNSMNSFLIFESIYGILCLIYEVDHKKIISYDLKNDIIINNIKFFTKYIFISNFSHFSDKINKRDLIISVYNKNNIMLWNFKNWECLLDIKNIYGSGEILSSCFLSCNNNIYIISCNYTYDISNNPIKVFDETGINIKTISNSNKSTLYIDIYYDTTLMTTFIIASQEGFFSSYDFNKNETYLIFKYDEDICYNNEYYNLYCNVIINEGIFSGKNNFELIGSCVDGKIRIWDFLSGHFLMTINCNNLNLNSICLWTSGILYAGCTDGEIKLIDLEKKIIIFLLHNDQNFYPLIQHKQFYLLIYKLFFGF